MKNKKLNKLLEDVWNDLLFEEAIGNIDLSKPLPNVLDEIAPIAPSPKTPTVWKIRNLSLYEKTRIKISNWFKRLFEGVQS